MTRKRNAVADIGSLSSPGRIIGGGDCVFGIVAISLWNMASAIPIISLVRKQLIKNLSKNWRRALAGANEGL